MRVRFVSVGAAILTLTTLPVLAANNGKGSPSKTTINPKSTHGKAATTTSTSPRGKLTTAASTHGKASPSTQGKAPATKTKTTTTATTASTHAKAPTKAKTTTTTTTGSPNPIASKIVSNSSLNTKVSGMLPKGMTVHQASSGFKNQGQFLAALHVSQNLDIPFSDLKQAMTGIKPTATGGTTGGTTTGGTTSTTETPSLLSLGQAIKKLRPTADSTTAVTTATKQATTDLSGK